MKRILAGIGILILLVPTAGVLIGRQAITNGFEIDGIRILTDGIVSIAVVPTTTNEVAVIDAGTDASGKAILAELSRRHLGPKAVTAILLTHGHRDDTAAILLFGNAQVMALGPDIALVEGKAGAGGPLTRVMPVRPTGVKVARALHNDRAIKGSAWIFTDNQAQDSASLVRLDRRLVQEGADVKAIGFAHEGAVAKGLAPINEFDSRNHQPGPAHMRCGFQNGTFDQESSYQ
jgi:hypothetical protein